MDGTDVAEVVAEQAVEVPALSITEHAAKYGPEGQKAEAAQAATETPEETAARHHSADQKREKDTGRFDEGKARHRANSQKATAADAPRIQQLTARAKGAEERAAAAERELAALKAQHAAPAKIAQAETKVEQTAAAADPEPVEDDPKYGGDYTKYLDARARWVARETLREERANEAKQRQQSERETATRQTLDSFRGRVDAAREKYDDFDAVAFAPTRIPADSAIDTFIMDDESGADVLYHLQSHGEELDELLAMPVLKQIKHLALLSQRFSSAPSELAGTNGSVAPRKKVELPPKPVNPLRTEAQRATEPPPTDGSLSIMKHAKAFKPR